MPYVNSSAIEELRPGLSEDAVRKLMLAPDTIQEVEKRTVWKWQGEGVAYVSSLTVHFVDGKQEGEAEHVTVFLPWFMDHKYSEVLTEGTDEAYVLKMMGRPMSRYRKGEQTTYVWEYRSRLRRNTNQHIFAEWVIGVGQVRVSTTIHVQGGKQVGRPIVEQVDLR